MFSVYAMNKNNFGPIVFVENQDDVFRKFKKQPLRKLFWKPPAADRSNENKDDDRSYISVSLRVISPPLRQGRHHRLFTVSLTKQYPFVPVFFILHMGSSACLISWSISSPS